MIIQLIRFAIVGVIAAIVDVGVLVILKELFHRAEKPYMNALKRMENV